MNERSSAFHSDLCPDACYVRIVAHFWFEIAWIRVEALKCSVGFTLGRCLSLSAKQPLQDVRAGCGETGRLKLNPWTREGSAVVVTCRLKRRGSTSRQAGSDGAFAEPSRASPSQFLSHEIAPRSSWRSDDLSTSFPPSTQICVRGKATLTPLPWFARAPGTEGIATRWFPSPGLETLREKRL